MKSFAVIILSVLSDMCSPPPPVSTCLPSLFHQTRLCHEETPSRLRRLLLFHMEPEMCLEKEEERGRNGSSATKASLLRTSNCLFKCCHGESPGWMAHLFFPFRLCPWISPWRPKALLNRWVEDMETENSGGSFSSLSLPQGFSWSCYINKVFIILPTLASSRLKSWFLRSMKNWPKSDL